MLFHGMQKTTLLDYPAHTATLLFTGGCNFRCPFCHNGDLVLHPNDFPMIDEEEIFAHLKKRRNVLNGVSITGGEPTLQSELKGFLEKVRELGYDVKLDTNGTSPDTIKDLLENGLLNYVAMDIKNTPEKYAETAGIPLSDDTMKKMRTTMDLLMHSDIDYEFRTTVIRELHTVEDIAQIASGIAGAKHYYLQAFRESEQVIEPGRFTPPAPDTLQAMVAAAQKYVEGAAMRGE